MSKQLLERIKRNIFVWVAGAGLGLGVGWFFTGLNDLVYSLTLSITPKEYYIPILALLILHLIFGALFLNHIRGKGLVRCFFGLLGILVGAVAAPLPVGFFVIYKILPVISDLSLIYEENVIDAISEVVVQSFLLFFISLTTIIFLLIGKGVRKLWSKVARE